MRPLNILTDPTSSLKTISILLPKKKSLILNLLKTKMSKFPMLISRSMNRLYSKTNWLNSFLLKTSSMKRILGLLDEEIPNLLHLMVVCPYCGALKEYIYDNIKAKVNIQCKSLAWNTFTVKTTIKYDIGIYCPHCKRKLTLHHDCNGYFVYVCMNQDCPYYKHNKEILDSDDRDSLLTSSNQYRLRYHYREFKFDMDPLKKTSQSLNTGFNI